MPRPGEISLANHGVLSLDKVPEFGTCVLEVMTQPMKDNVVTIQYVESSHRFHLRPDQGRTTSIPLVRLYDHTRSNRH